MTALSKFLSTSSQLKSTPNASVIIVNSKSPSQTGRKGSLGVGEEVKPAVEAVSVGEVVGEVVGDDGRLLEVGLELIVGVRDGILLKDGLALRDGSSLGLEVGLSVMCIDLPLLTGTYDS